MAGYQRLLKRDRVGKLAEYLRLSENNIIPAAVIVAVDSDYIQIVELSEGLCKISIDEDTRDFATKLAELWGQFTTRLAEEELKSADIFFSPHSPLVDDDLDNHEDDGGDPDDLPSVDDGGSPAGDTFHEGDDLEEEDEEEEGATFPTSYLASLAKELNDAVTNWDGISEGRQKAIRDYIEGVSKPGLIIDGQHRVFGAKDVSEHEIERPVSGVLLRIVVAEMGATAFLTLDRRQGDGF